MCWLNFAVEALQLCPNIRRLEYSGLECDVPEYLADHCRQLEALRLKGVVKGACLDAIAENCPHLKKLDINSVTGLSESTILTLLQRCSGLVNLSLNTGAIITDSTVLGIASYGANLKELRLHNALSLSTHTLAVLFIHRLNLRTFGLASSTVFFDPAAQFPPQCPITKLDFKDVFMTDHSFGLILEGCPALLELRMEACMDINSDALFLIAKCQRLQKLSLDICFVTDRVLEEVALGCGYLREVKLTGNLQISDTGVGELAHGCPLLQRITLPRHCREITDAAVLALAQNCPGLCLLEVGVGVTDAGMTAAAAAAPVRSPALTIKRW
jgi:F-box and leucine-rich repeat protein GRR1